jgi:membrane protease YdiL (CAAX protease family)
MEAQHPTGAEPAAGSLPVEQPRAAVPEKYRPVARWLHTALIVTLILLVGGITGWTSRTIGLEASGSAMSHYIQTIIWLWILAGFVYLGVRQYGVRLREVIGGRWDTPEDFLLDLAIAFAFWIAVILVLLVLRYLFFPQTLDLKEATKNVSGLIPHGALEIAVWMVMSVSAGLCEEFVFRGYLQRQFVALARNPAAGILLMAVVFSIGHLYQGLAQMAVIGVYGAMLGVLAYFRKSLRPGMMAHIWQDVLSGLILSVVSMHGVK